MEDESRFLYDALAAIPVSECDYGEWVKVGMALKANGYDCELWDQWSMSDSRYHSGECEKKWRTFKRSEGVTVGTIFDMAKKRGWTYTNFEPLDWDSEIEYDGDDMPVLTKTEWKPEEDIRKFLTAVFEPEDIIGYVVSDAWLDEDGKWKPRKGVYYQKCKDILAKMDKYGTDVSYVFGDQEKEAGAWIRFNPLDGNGVENKNVVAFRYALVESDKMPIPEQDALYRRLKLPIVTLVNSGNKSLHALVRVDAKDAKEYSKRVEFLYNYIEEKGKADNVKIDRQNSNPSRLSRFPGFYRGDKRQYLVAMNIGCKSWDDWIDWTEGDTDGLPAIEKSPNYSEVVTDVPEELIQGILRCGHKFLIASSSKAGKSFLLIQLAIAISEGRKWLGFQCRKGKVLYVNLEIDRPSFRKRIVDIYNALKIKNTHNFDVWNLRGKAMPMDKLAPKIIRKCQTEHYDAIIIDPIYKTIMGDENNASDMAAFCNQFDKIAETGASVIYCHHHSKGAQGGKKAIDRASGSGVFARDPDAQLDMIELEMPDEIKNYVADNGATAWRIESSLREFRNIKPLNVWFRYPIHEVDTSGALDDLKANGDPTAIPKGGRNGGKSVDIEEMDTAYDELASFYGSQDIPISSFATKIGVQMETVKKWIMPKGKFKDEYEKYKKEGSKEEYIRRKE